MNRYPLDEEISLSKTKLPKRKEGIVYVYELIDPRDVLTKYIGIVKKLHFYNIYMCYITNTTYSENKIIFLNKKCFF